MKPRIPSLEEVRTSGAQRSYIVAKRVLAHAAAERFRPLGISQEQEDLLTSFSDDEVEFGMECLPDEDRLSLELVRPIEKTPKQILVQFPSAIVLSTYQTAIQQLDRVALADWLCSYLQDAYRSKMDRLGIQYSCADWKSRERVLIRREYKKVQNDIRHLRRTYAWLLND